MKNDDIAIIEDGVAVDDVIAAWQHRIDTSEVLGQTSWHGRIARHLVDVGVCDAPAIKRPVLVVVNGVQHGH